MGKKLPFFLAIEINRLTNTINFYILSKRAFIRYDKFYRFIQIGAHHT